MAADINSLNGIFLKGIFRPAVSSRQKLLQLAEHARFTSADGDAAVLSRQHAFPSRKRPETRALFLNNKHGRVVRDSRLSRMSTSRSASRKNMKQEIIQANLAAAGSFQLGRGILSASICQRVDTASSHTADPLFKIMAIYHEDSVPFWPSDSRVRFFVRCWLLTRC